MRYGEQEDAAVGYHPQKSGRPSHHPLAYVISGTRLCLHMEWRKGNTVSASGWTEAMEKVWRSPVAQHRIRLNRGDIGFGQESIMAWHEQGKGKRPLFLFKLKLHGWSQERRVIVERRLKPRNASPQGTFWKQCVEDFSAYITNLTPEETDAFQIVQLYRLRADAENVFDEFKNQWGFSGFAGKRLR